MGTSKPFEKNDEMKAGLLKYDDGARELRREGGPIVTTLQISLSCLQEKRQSASKLLSLMSFFDGQGIAESLLHDQSGLDLAFDDDIQELQDYSLISKMDVHTAFAMHRLVQVATHAWLKKHDQLEKPRKQFINILSSRFPKGSYENWAVCQPLFPHVLSAMKHNEEQPFPEEIMLQWASVLNNASEYARKIGTMRDSEKMASQSMDTRNKILGPEHPETLRSMNNLASTYWNQGRYEEAEKLNVQVREAHKRILGPEHPHTLRSMYHLDMTRILRTLEGIRRAEGPGSGGTRAYSWTQSAYDSLFESMKFLTTWKIPRVSNTLYHLSIAILVSSFFFFFFFFGEESLY